MKEENNFFLLLGSFYAFLNARKRYGHFIYLEDNMKISIFFETYQKEIIVSSVFVLLSLFFMFYLALSNKRGDNNIKKFIIASLLLSIIFIGINYLLITNMDTPTDLKFSEDFIINISSMLRLIIINTVLLGIYALLAIQLVRKKEKKRITTTKVAIIGILISVSSVLMLFSIPIFPPAPFLKLEVSGLIIFMVFIWCDVKTAIIVSLLTNLIHVFMPGTSAPVILFLDEFVNFVATMSFLVPSLLFIKKDSFNDVTNENVIPYVILVGVAFTTIFMIMYNFLFNLPIVYGMEWEFKQVVLVFGAFNLIKWGSVGFLIILLWKKLVPLLNIKNN